MLSIVMDNKGVRREVERLLIDVKRGGSYAANPREVRELFKESRYGMGCTFCAPKDVIGQQLLYNCCLCAPPGFSDYALYYIVCPECLITSDELERLAVFPKTMNRNIKVLYSYYAPLQEQGNYIMIDMLIATAKGAKGVYE